MVPLTRTVCSRVGLAQSLPHAHHLQAATGHPPLGSAVPDQSCVPTAVNSRPEDTCRMARRLRHARVAAAVTAGLEGPPHHAGALKACRPSAHLRGHCCLPRSRLLLGMTTVSGSLLPSGPSASQPPLPHGHPFPRLLIQPQSTVQPAWPGLGRHYAVPLEKRSPTSSTTTSHIQATLWPWAPTAGAIIPSDDRFGVVGAWGLQAPASAFWPRSEAVPGELGDDSAEEARGRIANPGTEGLVVTDGVNTGGARGGGQ